MRAPSQRLLPRGLFRAAATLTSLSLFSPAMASNGLNLVGFGAESLSLGSADIAVSRDSSAVNINPAGLTQLSEHRVDGSLVPFWSFGFKHSDANNDDYPIDNPYGSLTNFSYAQRALRPDLTFGIGLFFAGGTGVKYEKLRTVFGTRDEYSAALGVTKLATGVGWKVNHQLSLGLGLNLSYSQGRQKIFPDTSNDAAGFYGLRLDGTDGFSFNGRLGMQYHLSPRLTLGASYASETKLKLDNGTVTVNYSDRDPALGRVKYRKASVDGFALAQEFGVGAAWQFQPRWLLAAEVTWLDWSRALGDARLKASRPDNPAAPAPTLNIRQPLNHDDQYVVGVGLAYDWSDKTVLRGGVNIARSPIPSNTLTPTLNLTADYEVDLGFMHRLSNGWEFATAMQIQPYKSERYTNPDQPFGPNAAEDYGVLALTLQFSRNW